MSLTSRLLPDALRLRAPMMQAAPQVAVLVDATGSMEPYIEAVRRDTKQALVRMASRHPGIGMACGFYRDHDCVHPFQFFGPGDATEGRFVGASGLAGLQAFLDDAGHVEGNRTMVEALGAGLFYASRLPWTARERVLVCVGDEPSHGFAATRAPQHAHRGDSIEHCELGMTHERILECLLRAQLRCYMVRCGTSKAAELQYRDIAAKTGGRFIDFDAATDAQGFLVAVEVALADATGGDARALIEQRQQARLLGGSTARALLESFDDPS